MSVVLSFSLSVSCVSKLLFWLLLTDSMFYLVVFMHVPCACSATAVGGPIEGVGQGASGPGRQDPSEYRLPSRGQWVPVKVRCCCCGCCYDYRLVWFVTVASVGVSSGSVDGGWTCIYLNRVKELEMCSKVEVRNKHLTVVSKRVIVHTEERNNMYEYDVSFNP